MCLREVNIVWNGFLDDGVVVIQEVLMYNQIFKVLDIGSNCIINKGVVLIVRILKMNKILEVLKIGWNLF